MIGISRSQPELTGLPTLPETDKEDDERALLSVFEQMGTDEETPSFELMDQGVVDEALHLISENESNDME